MTLKASPVRLTTLSTSFDVELSARMQWSAQTDAGIEQRVADILADVRQHGDRAVLDYTARLITCRPTA